jgi:hypothetical protein
MANLAPDIGSKLAKLIPRLASTHEGEVLATVEAIRRTLDRAELSLHDLAARLCAPEPVPPRARPKPRAKPEPAPDQDADELLAKAEWLHDHVRDDLTAKQGAFVATALRMLRAGQSLSDKQRGWLHGLAVMHGFGQG